MTEYRYSLGQVQEDEENDLPRFTIESPNSSGEVFLRTQRKIGTMNEEEYNFIESVLSALPNPAIENFVCKPMTQLSEAGSNQP